MSIQMRPPSVHSGHPRPGDPETAAVSVKQHQPHKRTVLQPSSRSHCNCHWLISGQKPAQAPWLARTYSYPGFSYLARSRPPVHPSMLTQIWATSSIHPSIHPSIHSLSFIIHCHSLSFMIVHYHSYSFIFIHPFIHSFGKRDSVLVQISTSTTTCTGVLLGSDWGHPSSRRPCAPLAGNRSTSSGTSGFRRPH